jgi:hypothetical protein
MASLHIDWVRFIPALILLLTPVAVFHGSRVRFREIDRDWSGHRRQIARLWLHYFDFLRAAAGTWLLLAALTSAPDAHGMARQAPLLLQGSIRLLAIVLQTVVCKERDYANAPFAFVTGLLITGASPLVATIALALAIPLTLGSRTPIAFFPLLAVTFAAASPLFGGKTLFIKILPGAMGALVPWLWSLLFHRELVIAYRAHRSTRTTPSIPPTAEKR